MRTPSPDGAARHAVGALTKPKGFVPVNFIFGEGYNIERPDNIGNSFVRFQVNFNLPK
jgi:hypothetical protein